MRLVKIISIIVVSVVLSSVFSGCATTQAYNDMKLKNRTQQEYIANLESQISSLKMQQLKLQEELAKAQGLGNIDIATLKEELAALEKAIAEKNDLIAKMQKQLLSSGAPLPAELNAMLSEFANKNSDMVTFDEATGMLKFKSDLLFAPGSDVVQSDAVQAMEALAKIMTADEAKDFDVVVAGHTDDMRIGKASTLQRHPTNWHLSTNRAISVLNVLEKNGVVSTRVSARGFGEYRPIAENKANKGGNQANRRVEIFIVPKGM